jgi:spore germination protein
MIKKTFFPICCCFMLLSGCVLTETIEDIQIIESIGYDTAEDKKYQLTFALVLFSSSEKGAQLTSETLSNEDLTGYGASWSVQRELSKPIASGKMMVALFGEDLSKKGLTEILDGLRRHTSVGRMVDLCVVEGDAKELLEGQYPQSQTVSRYLKELIEHNEKANLPITNFHKFLYSYYSKGHDSFLPLVKKHGDKIRLSGLALFKDDKYVDKISGDQLFIFKMLYEEIKKGHYQASIQGKSDNVIAMETVQTKVKYKIIDGMTQPKIQVNVKVKAIINEMASNVELNNKKEELKLEKMLENDLKEKGIQMMGEFQEKGIDPLGIADRARSQTRGWESKKWQEIYPEASVDLNVNVDILETGIAD